METKEELFEELHQILERINYARAKALIELTDLKDITPKEATSIYLVKYALDLLFDAITQLD